MRLRDKLLLLASLYVAQGLPFGFFTQAVPVLLREAGASLPAVGVASALATPWGLKFLWAPLVDRFGSARLGHRRGWILATQGLSIVALAAIAVLGEDRLSVAALVLVVVVNLASATQDIATDALAVSLLRPAERGLGNGVQVAGYRVGMIVGGGALLAAFPALGLRGIAVALGLFVALTTLPVLRFREGPRATAGAPPVVLDRSRLRHPAVLRFVAVLATYKAGEALATGMLRPFLVDAGLSLSEIGVVLGTFGFGGGLVGSLAGGAAVSKLGRRPALVAFGAAQSIAIAGYAAAATASPSFGTLCAIVGLEHFAAGMATAALFTAMMDACRPGREATDYTLMASVVVVATGTASFVAGWSAATFGYAAHFAVASAASAVAALGLVGRGRSVAPFAVGTAS